MASPFKFKNAALMMALAAAYPLQAHAVPAGTALFSAGDVTVRRGAGSESLAKGGNVESGDVILTGAQGRAQLRFSDGGLVALQPNSQFNIAKYSDANDPKQDAFLVDLLRGGMRAVTGLIGKRNRDNYKVTTTTATIGIRGSSFFMSYLPDGTLVVSTEQDAIEVCTKAGCTGLTAGESVRVLSADSEPVRTSTRATIPVPEPRREPVTTGDNSRTNSTASLVPTAPSPAPAPKDSGIRTGMAFASAGLLPNLTQTLTETPQRKAYQPLDQRQYMNGTLVVDPTNGKPSFYLGENNDRVSSSAVTTVVASTGTYDTKDLLILGTWTDSTWVQGSGGVGTGLAGATLSSTGFVTGVPTPTTALSSLSGIRGEYSLASATPVYTTTSGVTGEVLSTSKLSVDFLGAGTFADVNIDVRFPALVQTLATVTETPVANPNSTDYNLRGGISGTGAGFAGSLSVSSAACIAGTNACGTGYATGFLVGPNASKAGLSFTANDTIYGNFGGAATFAQTSSAATPTTTVGTGGMVAYLGNSTGTIGEGVGVTSWNVATSTASGSGYGYFTDNNFKFTGEALVSVKRSSGSTFNGTPIYQNSSLASQTGGATLNYGALGKVTDSDFIGWGVWAQGSYNQINGSGSGSTSANGFTHYIAGTPTSLMPSGGTATYGLVGGTAPTAVSGSGAAQTGQLLNASLSVNFSTSSASLNVSTKFGATQVNISNSSLYLNGGTINSCGGVQVNGIFTGNQAYRAGLVYQATGTAVGTVTGAAAFQRNGAIQPYSGLAQ